MLRPETLALNDESRALYDRFVPSKHPLRQFDDCLAFSFILPRMVERSHLGSLVAGASAPGGEVWSGRDWPVGGLRSSTGTPPTDRLFTRQTRDLEDDRFSFFKARYYDATIGKFVQPDTVVPDGKNPQALNRYADARNNPLRLVDPSGHDPVDWFNAQWVNEFRAAHQGANPTVNDYAYRFITMAQASGMSVPEAFAIPAGVDLGANFKEMHGLATESSSPVTQTNGSGGFFLLGSLSALVMPGGPWDYKHWYGKSYYGFGNFNYGAVAAALGLPEWFLLRGAGGTQVLTTFAVNIRQFIRRVRGDSNASPVDYEPGIPFFGSGSHGDNPDDQAMIELGYAFYQAYEAAPPPSTIPSGSGSPTSAGPS